MLDDINLYLYQHIPITERMGICVSGYRDDQVVLSMPLAPNLNHRDTAFGGSISTLGILAGWTLLHLQYRDSPVMPRLVIQHSETDFIAAVTAACEAVCHLPGAAGWRRFQRGLEKYRRARLRLEADIQVDGHLVAQHRGDYVAIMG